MAQASKATTKGKTIAPQTKPVAGQKAAVTRGQSTKLKKPLVNKEGAKAEATKVTGTKTTIKLTLALDAPKAKIEAMINSIAKRGAKLQDDLHSAACASLNHASLHNDPVLLNRLVTALPLGVRRNALVVWAMQFGNLGQNPDNKRQDMPLVYMKDKKADIEAAVAMPFWEFRNVREGGSTFVFTDFVGNFKTRIRNQIDKLPEVDRKKALAILHAIENTEQAFAVTEPTPKVKSTVGKGEAFNPEKHAERRQEQEPIEKDRRLATVGQVH